MGFLPLVISAIFDSMSYTFEDEKIPESQLADFGSRLGAILIDSALFTFVILIIGGLFVGLVMVETDMGNEDPNPMTIVAGVLLYAFGPSIVILIYQSAMESSKYQGTLGKMLVGIKVVTSEGEPISFANALGRNLGRILSSFLFIGYFMVLFTDRKQALHDMMADTLVVKKDTGRTYV